MRTPWFCVVEDNHLATIIPHAKGGDTSCIIYRYFKQTRTTLKVRTFLKYMCIEKFSRKKHSYLKELLKLFILILYNFSISYFVLEILRFV